MKTKYFYALVLGMIILTNTVRSQNLLFDGEFSQTTEIIPFDDPTPPLNTWVYSVNEYNDAEVNPLVADGVVKIEMENAGYDYPDVQFAQLGFPLIQGHVYQLSFDVRADADRNLRLFLGEEGGSAINLIETFYFDVTTEWQTLSLEFVTTFVFDLHKLSFELGGNGVNTYFDNVILQDLGPATATSVSLWGSIQVQLGCDYGYNWECEYSALELNEDSGLWEGSFVLPAGCYSFLVNETLGSTEVLYGENGILGGDEIQLYVPSDSEVTFQYDPQTHIIQSSPFEGAPQEVIRVSLRGSLQTELGCDYDYDYDCEKPALDYNTSSGLWEGSFTLPAGCYSYWVRETTTGCNGDYFYGENGIVWGNEIQLYMPADGEVSFEYDPQSHTISSTPYGAPPQEAVKISLLGSLQDEIGCNSDYDESCNSSTLTFNPDSNRWEANFNLPSGCYTYWVKEEYICKDPVLYGENGVEGGYEIQLYIPSDSEISFSYDQQNHIMDSTPYNGISQDAIEVTLIGSFQEELGCFYDGEDQCDKSALTFDSELNIWNQTFTLPAGCYSYRVKENYGCDIFTYYGDNGVENGDEIILYVPTDGEVTFQYDHETHLITSMPFSSPEISTVSLTGNLKDELCEPEEYECDNSNLVFNSNTGLWEGNFTLPKGCYIYQVQETTACSRMDYGENGEVGGYVRLYVPQDGEINFLYDPQTHVISSSPYSGSPQELTSVSLFGSLQSELGCDSDNDSACDEAALIYNSDTGYWEGSFTLPAGCYSYRVQESFGCEMFFYGENGVEWQDIQLYLPTEAEITFIYDRETHLITSTPFSGNPQEPNTVSLVGSFQNELGCPSDDDFSCDQPALAFNSNSGLWEGKFTLPPGCYSYWVQETVGCNTALYGENDYIIQLYVPSEGEVSFSYNHETHVMSSSPPSGLPQEVISVSLNGSIEDTLGCDSNSDTVCEKSSLMYDPDTGFWEGSFTLPAGCYLYSVEEKSACDTTIYGENGMEWGSDMVLYVPTEGAVTFSYDPSTHITVSTPYSEVPQELTAVSLLGSLQEELGCEYDYVEDCDNSELVFNPDSGLWEGTFSLPAGCFNYQVQETFGCYTRVRYGENGVEWGNDIQLFVPSNTEITFSYDQQTHIISSTPNFDLSAANQCPETIYVNNSPGTCGAVVNYPGFFVTEYCGGDVLSVTQTAGFPSGSEFPIGTTTNIYELVKTTGEVINCSFDVVVTDVEAPVITDLNESYEPLWPPNHKMVPIFLAYSVSDNCSEATTVLSVSSNEAQSGRGKGDQAPDWEIIDNHNLLLRAERDPKGTGREYYITIRVTDEAGNYTEEVVTVRVPLNNGKATGDLTESENYKLYPSPADEVVKIKGPESVAGRSYSIYDMLGVMKLSGIIRNDMVEVFLLPNGTYVLKFTTDKGNVSKQFIKH